MDCINKNSIELLFQIGKKRDNLNSFYKYFRKTETFRLPKLSSGKLNEKVQ
jgi:hypothetical protein